MFKIFTSLFLILSISVIATAQDEYIFKAKGKFAKELKALMQKYAKEGKVEIQEAPAKSSLHRSSTTILDAFLNNEETVGDIAYGKRLYKARCIKCHGVNASEKKYNNSRVLTKLDKETLIDQLENYSSDAEYGKSTKFLMYEAVSGLTTDQMISIAAYIYSINHSTEKITAPTNSSKSDKKNSNEAPSTYLQ